MQLVHLLLLMLISPPLLAQDAPAPSRAIEQEKLPRVLWMATSNGPPYMIQESNSGLDIEIPRAALEKVGYRMSVRYMSLSRAAMEVRSGRMDLMAPTFIQPHPATFLADPHVFYWPTVFSMAESKFTISAVQDLAKYRILTFQGARGYFGQAFIDASEQAPAYLENHEMSTLPQLLIAARGDVVVLDYYIFHYFHQKLRSNQVTPPRVTSHHIFKKVPAAVAFHDEAIRDDFNAGLKMIKDDGSYREILEKYSR